MLSTQVAHLLRFNCHILDHLRLFADKKPTMPTVSGASGMADANATDRVDVTHTIWS
jgi:hypothetical protein